MKKVMVNAYTSFNLGDDLFIKILCERYPNTRFFLFAPKEYRKTFGDIRNLSIIADNSLIIRGLNFIFRRIKKHILFRRLIVRKIAKKCDAAVYIGGSLFMQSNNWNEALNNVNNMRIGDKPFYLLGANFGPYSNFEYYKMHKELFIGYTDICFREKYSYNLFSDLENVRHADDIIFQTQSLEIKPPQKNIVISVIKPSKKGLTNYEEIYYQKISELLIFFIIKGYIITLISFCESEGDSEAIDAICNLVPKEYLDKVNVHLYKNNIDKTLYVIASSSFVIATRFHSMILGWRYNKPVFPIAYSTKMINVMEDLGFNGTYTNFNDLHKLQPELVFRSLDSNLIDVSKQSHNAEKHFEKLDEFLVKS